MRRWFRSDPPLDIADPALFPSVDNYVVLLASQIVMGQAFGSCPNSTRTDTIDWAYTSVTPPANVPQLASASGGKDGNLLLKAYFGDNVGKVVSASVTREIDGRDES